MKGLFVTFEGPDASGKTTQLHLLESYLREKGFDPLMTREPGGTAISEKIRNIILDKENPEMLPVTEALLYAASRAQHVGEKLIPALRSGRIVISDRFLDSSVAYQGYARGLGDMVKNINQPAISGLVPDVTFFLKIDPSLMRERRSRDKEDRMDGQEINFHNKVLDGYIEIAKSEPERIFVIEAERNIDEIFDDIKAIIDKVMISKGLIYREISSSPF